MPNVSEDGVRRHRRALNSIIDMNAVRTALSPGFAKRSVMVAVIVGTILNVINQGHALAGEADFRLWTAMLTYCVPFFVSSYGAYAGLARNTATLQSRQGPEQQSIKS